MDIQEIKDESGVRGENKVQKVLDSFCNGRYIRNFIMRYKTFYVEIASTEIDFLLVMEKYIFCIEVKNWNTIRNYDSKKDEYYVRINKNNRHFKSPIYQNQFHKERLVEFLGIDESRIVCISVICTDDDTDKVFVRSYNNKDRNLVRLDQLKNSIRKYELEDVPNLPDRNQICSTFDRLNWGDVEEIVLEHKKFAQRYKKMTDDEKKLCKFYVCNKCGRPLEYVHEGKYGSYAKCPGFPCNCDKKTISINQIEQYESFKNEERLIYRMLKSEYECKIGELKKEISEMTEELDEIRHNKKKQEMLLGEVIEDKNKAIEEAKELRDVVSGEQYRRMRTLFEEKISSVSKINNQLSDELQVSYSRISDLEEKYSRTLEARVENLLKLVIGKIHNRIG